MNRCSGKASASLKPNAVLNIVQTRSKEITMNDANLTLFFILYLFLVVVLVMLFSALLEHLFFSMFL